MHTFLINQYFQILHTLNNLTSSVCDAVYAMIGMRVIYHHTNYLSHILNRCSSFRVRVHIVDAFED